MNKLSPRTIWNAEEKELSRLLDDGTFLREAKRIHFYAPSFMYYRASGFCPSEMNFPTVSVTGRKCALRCRHCGGTVLDTMYPAETPEKLGEVCRELKKKGAQGLLLSGGCDLNGSVSLERFGEAIKKIRRELGLTVFVHSGIVSPDTARMLQEAGVDAVLIDVIGSDETIREICHLETTVDSYERSLRALKDADLTFVPHVIVGLHYGKLMGELNALEIVSRYDPAALVIIAFMPITGTAMEKVQPPRPIDIARVVATARTMLWNVPLTLGCMRPKGRHRAETDVLALKAGVDAVAFPSEECVEFARKNGWEAKFSSFCCSQIFHDAQPNAISDGSPRLP